MIEVCDSKESILKGYSNPDVRFEIIIIHCVQPVAGPLEVCLIQYGTHSRIPVWPIFGCDNERQARRVVEWLQWAVTKLDIAANANINQAILIKLAEESGWNKVNGCCWRGPDFSQAELHTYSTTHEYLCRSKVTGRKIEAWFLTQSVRLFVKDNHMCYENIELGVRREDFQKFLTAMSCLHFQHEIMLGDPSVSFSGQCGDGEEGDRENPVYNCYCVTVQVYKPN